MDGCVRSDVGREMLWGLIGRRVFCGVRGGLVNQGWSKGDASQMFGLLLAWSRTIAKIMK